MDSFEFVDIHSHILPGIDDGSTSLEESFKMAEIAVADGIRTMIATPHQLGNYGHNRGDEIRERVAKLQAAFIAQDLPLTVLSGGDVRIEPGMIAGLQSGEIMSLGDKRRHVLLELPHELYFPLEPVLRDLDAIGMQGILSHPERNLGIRKQPKLIPMLVAAGCLMQVTAGSLMGTFGPAAKTLGEKMVKAGHVHFLATDAHRSTARRPLMRRAFERAVELVGMPAAKKMCCENPALVEQGQTVKTGKIAVGSSGLSRWFKSAA